MRVLDKAIFMQAHKDNFNPNVRALNSIRYIVLHYTGNTGDTAKNNAVYFRDNVVKASAHYFINDSTIYQSVPDNHAAYAVGLGSRTEPYFKWPSMWNTITNSNSISIEMCGSKSSSEASQETKDTAAKLAADLCEKYGLTPSCVYRHYDVTGKSCPRWAVDDNLKWLEITLAINKEFYHTDEKEEEQVFILETPENYAVFCRWMDRYLEERAAMSADWEAGAMEFCKQRGLINDGRPKSAVTRGELATVLQRMLEA